MSKFTIKPLPYDYAALEPVISAETLTFHHDKHYVGYVNRANELIADTPYETMTIEQILQRSASTIFDNAAQVINHEFFFDQLSPEPQKEPTGKLMDAIAAKFGSFENLKEQMLKNATSLFGSGWVWLVADNLEGGVLSIRSCGNAGNPAAYGLTTLLAIDVWEHAYYIDYRNNRAESVEMLWNVIDWRVIEERYGAM